MRLGPSRVDSYSLPLPVLVQQPAAQTAGDRRDREQLRTMAQQRAERLPSAQRRILAFTRCKRVAECREPDEIHGAGARYLVAVVSAARLPERFAGEGSIGEQLETIGGLEPPA